MRNPRSLIISQDKPRSRLMQTHLTRAGFSIQVLESGEEVLGAILDLKPMLVLLDWRFPKPNSLTIIRIIRTNEQTRQLPIILMGSEMESGDRLRALDAGADLCLEEPFQGREFIARVKALLRRVYPQDFPCLAQGSG